MAKIQPKTALEYLARRAFRDFHALNSWPLPASINSPIKPPQQPSPRQLEFQAWCTRHARLPEHELNALVRAEREQEELERQTRDSFNALQTRAVNWGFWLSVGKVQLWEAVALSLGLNPEAFSASTLPTRHGDFGRALGRALRATGRGGPIGAEAEVDHFSVVDLQEVAAFFSRIGLALPPELAKLAEAASKSEPGSPVELPHAARDSTAVSAAPPPWKLGRPPLQQRSQEDAIISKLVEHGYDPHQMPKAPKGNKPWELRERIRVELGYSEEVMKKAWTRLRSEGQIKDRFTPG